MKLQANPKSAHIRVTSAPDELLSKLRPDQTSHSAVYVVRGITVGTTHLMFNATTVGAKVISSWPSEIQVFDALKLSPEYITLLPTAVFQVSFNWGEHEHKQFFQQNIFSLTPSFQASPSPMTTHFESDILFLHNKIHHTALLEVLT